MLPILRSRPPRINKREKMSVFPGTPDVHKILYRLKFILNKILIADARLDEEWIGVLMLPWLPIGLTSLEYKGRKVDALLKDVMYVADWCSSLLLMGKVVRNIYKMLAFGKSCMISDSLLYDSKIWISITQTSITFRRQKYCTLQLNVSNVGSTISSKPNP